MGDGMENPLERDPTNFMLADWQQAKRHGIDPRWMKRTLQVCWARSDGVKAFQRSLEERSFFLARGDRRGFVVIDHNGEVYSLARLLALKAKDVRARLGDGEGLPSVEAAQKQIGDRMTPAIQRHVSESKLRFRARMASLDKAKAQITERHRADRATLDRRLDAERQAQLRARAALLPTGLRGLWARVTGWYRQMRGEIEIEMRSTDVRHRQEQQTLIDRQLSERKKLQGHINDLRRRQAQEFIDLRKEVGHYLRLSRNATVSAEPQNAPVRDQRDRMRRPEL